MSEPQVNVHFVAPRMAAGHMVPFTLTSEMLAELNGLPWANGDAVYASFTPMRRLFPAVYVERTEQGHKVKIDGRVQYVSYVFPIDVVDALF